MGNKHIKMYHIVKVMPTCNEFTYSCVEQSRLCSTLSISMQVLTNFHTVLPTGVPLD